MEASCSCGQLTVVAEGDPIRVSMCHCLACQRRTGSTYGAQARFPRDRTRISGEARDWQRRADDDGEGRTFSFCPVCGATVYYVCESEPDVLAIPVGAFADPSFPPPVGSFHESRRHAWVSVPEGAEREG